MLSAILTVKLMDKKKKKKKKKKNQTKLFRMADTGSLINRIFRLKATVSDYVMSGEELVTTGMIDGKRSRGKHRKKMLYGLTKWLKVRRVTDAVKLLARTMRDRDKWTVMILINLWL